MPASDVVVVGGGVIGLATAWRCGQRGLRVTVIDAAPGQGASATAAGMLAPVTELHYEGRELLALNLESARRYPAFAAELLDATGIDVLLTPVTADEIAKLVATGQTSDVIAAFTPNREAG